MKETKTPNQRVCELIREYENEVKIEQLSGNVVKETMARGIVLGLRIAHDEYECKPT